MDKCTRVCRELKRAGSVTVQLMVTSFLECCCCWSLVLVVSTDTLFPLLPLLLFIVVQVRRSALPDAAVVCAYLSN